MNPKNQALSLVLFAALAAVPRSSLAQDVWKPTFGVGIGGVQVEAVDADSVGAGARLKAGDRIISWNGSPVVDIPSLREWLADVDAGAKCTIEVWRKGEGDRERHRLELKLQFPDSLAPSGSAALGVTPSFGVCVTNIQPNSVAATSGLLPGDVIVNWNGQSAESFEVLKNHVGRSKLGSRIRLDVIRNGEPKTLNARFSGGKVDPVEEPSSKGEKPRRNGRRQPIIQVPDGEGNSPFGGIAAIAELGDIADELAQTIKRLHAVEARGEEWRNAMEQLEKINERISRMAESVNGMKRLFSGFSDVENPFGFDSRSGGVTEEGSEELPDVPFMEEMEERLHELLGEGVDPDEISEIISNEFPGVHVEIRSGGPEETGEHDERSRREAEEAVRAEAAAREKALRADAEKEARAKEARRKEAQIEKTRKQAESRKAAIKEVRLSLRKHSIMLENLRERSSELREQLAGAEGEARTRLNAQIEAIRAESTAVSKNLEKLMETLGSMKKK